MRPFRAIELPITGLALLLLAACTGVSSPPPSAPMPSGSPIPGASAAPTHDAAPTDPAAETPSSTAIATTPPLEAWTSTQLVILAGVPTALRIGCAPAVRLPEGAADGVQCHPPRVQSMGFYAFDDKATLNALYFRRLGEYGVEPDSDGCEDGKPGESIDVPGLPGFEQRVGCYVDENGFANVRVASPGEPDELGMYVGVVGLDGDLMGLLDRLFPQHHTGDGCGWCADLWRQP